MGTMKERAHGRTSVTLGGGRIGNGEMLDGGGGGGTWKEMGKTRGGEGGGYRPSYIILLNSNARTLFLNNRGLTFSNEYKRYDVKHCVLNVSILLRTTVVKYQTLLNYRKLPSPFSSWV